MRLFYPSFFLLATPNLHRADFSSASGHGAPSPAPPAPRAEKPSQQTDSNPTTASSPAALPPPRQALRPRALPHPAPLRAAPPRRRAVPPCRLLGSIGRSGLAPNGALWYTTQSRSRVTPQVLNLPPTGHYGIPFLPPTATDRSFELAPNGALWYISVQVECLRYFVLNLPPTGHYGIDGVVPFGDADAF